MQDAASPPATQFSPILLRKQLPMNFTIRGKYVSRFTEAAPTFTRDNANVLYEYFARTRVDHLDGDVIESYGVPLFIVRRGG